MPDWLAHISLAYIVVWIVSKSRFDHKVKKYYSVFILGNLICDLDRPITYLIKYIFQNQNEFASYLSSRITLMTHSLIGVFLLSLFLSSFFTKNNWRKICLVFFLGGIGHILLDMTMYPWDGMGLAIFAPFLIDQQYFSFHLVWPGSILPLIILGTIALILIVIDLIIFKRFFIYNLNKKFFKSLSIKNNSINTDN